MFYYIIRNADKENHISAIHQVLDSAVAVFDKMVTKSNFTGYLEIVRISTDTQGMTIGEFTIQSYSSKSGMIISHQIVDGVLHVQNSPSLSIRVPSSPKFSIRLPEKMTVFDTIERQ